MTTEATKATTTATEEALTTPCEMGRPLLLNCNAVIRGAELIPAKLIAILDYHLQNIQKETGLLAITFRRDSRPAAKLGVSYPWAYSASINLQQIFNKVWAKVSDQDFGLHLPAALWLGLLETTIHEISHIHMATLDEEAFEGLVVAGDESDMKDDEEATKEIAREFMLELFKTVDCECPAVADMGFFAGLIQEVFLTDDSDSSKRSRRMIEQNVAYLDEADDRSTYYKTLRDYVRNTLVPEGDEEWAGDVNLIKITFQMEDGSEVVEDAEPVVDAASELPVVEEHKPVEPVITAVPVPDNAADMIEETPDEMDAIADAFGKDVASEFLVNVDDDTPAAEAVIDVQATPVEAAPAVMPASQQAPSETETATVVQPAEETTSPEAQLGAMFQSSPQAAPDQLPELNIPFENIQACMSEIYLRLHSNIFLKAGWSVDPNTNRWTFAEPYAVTASVSVGDLLEKHGCQGLIHEYVSFAEGAQIKPGDKASSRYSCTGNIQGFVFTDKGLPAYELHLNINGQRVIRKLVAQNPNKIVNNAYTKGADFCGVGGNRVTFVFKDEVRDPKAQFNERCSIKITNEQIQVMS